MSVWNSASRAEVSRSGVSNATPIGEISTPGAPPNKFKRADYLKKMRINFYS